MSSHSPSPTRGRAKSPGKGGGKGGGGGGGSGGRRRSKSGSGGDSSGGDSSGGSKSPDGRVRGRDREKRRGGSPRRAAKTKKKAGGPEVWTREELFDRIRKFGTFKIDRGTGVGTLESVNRRIMPDDAIVISEIFRRYTEVQSVTLQRCFLTDDTFLQIAQNLPNLRHLRVLNLMFNSLSSPSVARIVSIFNFKDARPDRRIEEIDLRNNNLSAPDGQALYDAFPIIKSLNGIKLGTHRKETTLREVHLADSHCKGAEVKILASLLKALIPQHLTSIDLSNNKLNCKALKDLAHALSEVENVRSLDISNNPVTDGGLDFSGLESLVTLVRSTKWLCELKMADISGLTPLQQDQMQRALQVNRSLNVTDDDGLHKDRFYLFVKERMAKTVKPLPPAPVLEDMDPVFHVDLTFCRLNRVPERLVDASRVSEHGQGFRLLKRYDKRATKERGKLL